MTRQEAFDKTHSLYEDFATLREGFVVDVSNDYGVNDLRKLANFQEKLWALCRLILTESLFAQLNDEVEDDKSLFVVQKKAKRFCDEILFPYIDDIITMSKQWDFHDYRAVNFQEETKYLATEIRNMYVEIYR